MKRITDSQGKNKQNRASGREGEREREQQSRKASRRKEKKEEGEWVPTCAEVSREE